MILTLEIISPQAKQLGAARRKTFDPKGGIIGRNKGIAWELPDPDRKVSGAHARISFSSGTYYIEDTSTNGVGLNSRNNRLTRGRPEPLQSGDRLFIDPYEIEVSVGSGSSLAGDDPFGPSASPRSQEPFSPQPSWTTGPSLEPVSEEEVDPLKLLGGPAKKSPAPKAPTLRDLHDISPLADPFTPPAVRPVMPPPRPEPVSIPAGYDPLAPDEPSGSWGPPPAVVPPPDPFVFEPPTPTPFERPTPTPVASATPAPFAPRTPVPFERPTPTPFVDPEPPPPVVEPPAAFSAPQNVPREAARVAPVSPPPPASPAPPLVPSGTTTAAADLAEVMEGAGLKGTAMTPDLARSFWRILRIIVSGVMDLLEARREVREVTGGPLTRVGPRDNNPLKFSVDVDDALHNLLVKRSAAYMDPVTAFEAAFADVKCDQLAILAGMRAAYKFMLEEFDPKRLQGQFEGQVKGSILPAKLRYWELYAERYQSLVKDPEAGYNKLFGKEFATAYEQQFMRLKAEKTGKKGST